MLCRTSHEVRGLKCLTLQINWSNSQSHLTRGAWIEILVFFLMRPMSIGRTSHEVRGLKYLPHDESHLLQCRTSHEVRGLK